MIIITHPDIEFNRSPEYKHCRIPMPVGNYRYLGNAHDGAYGREEAQKEEAYKTRLLCGSYVQLQQKWYWKDNNDHVANNCKSGKPVVRWSKRQTGAIKSWVP